RNCAQLTHLFVQPDVNGRLPSDRSRESKHPLHSYLGTGLANNSTVEKFADPAIPCPPPGASEASPTSSTLLRSGFFTSSMTTSFCGSSLYHFIPENAIST